MTSLTALFGRQAVSRNSAQDLGAVHDAVLDIPTKKVVAWQIGKGRKAQIVEQSHVVGIGDAAMMVDDDASLREAGSDAELDTVRGHRSLLDSLVLTDAGDELGKVTDAEIDPDSAAVVSVRVGEHPITADRLLGFGTYALVVRA